jgi:hypothetical protein
MHGTMKNAALEDAEGLIIEEGVADNITDFRAIQDKKSEVNDDLGVLGQKEEEIQPNIKNSGITDDHVKIINDAWINLLTKGELNIGKVLYRNLF